MNTTPKALVSKMISSPVADLELQIHAAGKGLWHMVSLLCEKTLAASVTRIEAGLGSTTIMSMPGYGSSAFKGDPKAATLSDYIGAIDAAAPSDNTVLFGYSHGGYFTTQYALQNPGKVRALVLVEPALFSARDDLLERAALIDGGKDLESMVAMLKSVESSAGRSEEQLHQLAQQLLGAVNSGAAVAQEYRIRAEHAVSMEDLAGLDMPVLLIAGTRSHASFMVKQAFQAIPHASVCWIEGASHLDLEKVEYAAQIARAVESFLENAGSNGGTGFRNLMAELDSSRTASEAAALAQ